MSVVSLEKGGSVSLEKVGGQGLSEVFMGLGWDPITKRGLFGTKKVDVDLDASVIMFADDKSIVDIIYYGNLDSRCRSIHHTGDNLTGDGDGDDEVIEVSLSRIPGNVKSLVFTVSSYSGDLLSQIENAFCRLVDKDGRKELVRFDLSGMGDHTALIMAKLSRTDGGWEMTAIGHECDGKTVGNLQAIATPYA